MVNSQGQSEHWRDPQRKSNSASVEGKEIARGTVECVDYLAGSPRGTELPKGQEARQNRGREHQARRKRVTVTVRVTETKSHNKGRGRRKDRRLTSWPFCAPLWSQVSSASPSFCAAPGFVSSTFTINLTPPSGYPSGCLAGLISFYCGPLYSARSLSCHADFRYPKANGTPQKVVVLPSRCIFPKPSSSCTTIPSQLQVHVKKNPVSPSPICLVAVLPIANQWAYHPR